MEIQQTGYSGYSTAKGSSNANPVAFAKGTRGAGIVNSPRKQGGSGEEAPKGLKRPAGQWRNQNPAKVSRPKQKEVSHDFKSNTPERDEEYEQIRCCLNGLSEDKINSHAFNMKMLIPSSIDGEPRKNFIEKLCQIIKRCQSEDLDGFDCACETLYEVVKEIPDDQREGLLQSVQNFIHKEMDSFQIIMILSSLTNLQEKAKNSFQMVEHVKAYALSLEENNGYNLSLLIGDITKLYLENDKQCLMVVNLSRILIEEKLKVEFEEKLKVESSYDVFKSTRDFIKKYSSSNKEFNLEDMFNRIKLFITPKMKECDYDRIIKSVEILYSLPDVNKISLLNQYDSLINNKFNRKHNFDLFNSILRFTIKSLNNGIYLDEINNVLELSQQLINPQMKEIDFYQVFLDVSSTDKKERRYLVGAANGSFGLFKILSKLPLQNVKCLMGFYERLEKLCRKDFIKKMSEKEIQGFVNSLNNVYNKIIEKADEDTRDIVVCRELEKNNVLCKLQNKFIKLANSLFKDNMIGSDYECGLESLAKLSLDSLDEFDKLVHSFITDDMTGSDCKLIIKALTRVSVEHLEAFSEQVKSFIKDQMKGKEKVDIIIKIAEFGLNHSSGNIMDIVYALNFDVTSKFYMSEKVDFKQTFNPEDLQDIIGPLNEIIRFIKGEPKDILYVLNEAKKISSEKRKPNVRNAVKYFKENQHKILPEQFRIIVHRLFQGEIT